MFGAIAVVLLSAFQVPSLICAATDYDPAVAFAREEFVTTNATVEKELENSGVSEINHRTPVGSDWFDKWERPGRLKQWFPTYKLGTDDDGVPIYLVLYGRLNFTAVLDQGSEEEKAGVDPYFDYVTDGYKVDDEANGGNGIVAILDWDGFSVRNFNSPAAVRLAVGQLVKLGKVYNVIKHAYSINTNFAAETLINLSKPYLGKMLEKTDVYGTRREKWVPQLRRSIPEHLLPLKYGGNKENIEL